jgi:hypothetical protein
MKVLRLTGNRTLRQEEVKKMKRHISAVGAIVFGMSLFFLGCDERNQGQGVGSAPSEQNRGPVGPSGPQNPERPGKTTEQTNR